MQKKKSLNITLKDQNVASLECCEVITPSSRHIYPFNDYT